VKEGALMEGEDAHEWVGVPYGLEEEKDVWEEINVGIFWNLSLFFFSLYL